MRSSLPALLLFLFSLFALSSCNKEEPLTADNNPLVKQIEKMNFFTENYPPFNYEEEGILYGVSVDILEALFTKMKVSLDRRDFQPVQWAAGYQTVLQTPNTMLFSTVRLPERENLFKWVGPIAPHKDVIISLKSRHVVINSAADLQNYKIGAIKDYSSIQILLNAGVSPAALYQANNAGDLYGMLANGTVDCIAYTEIGHKLILNALGLNEADYEFPYTLRVSELYYAFNISTSNEIISFFQNALDNLKNDKTGDGNSIYEKIINNYHIIRQSEDGITLQQVMNLVDITSNHLAADAPGTLIKMNNGEHPYKDKDLPALYSFAYDTSVTMRAHAENKLLVGVSFRGKTDVAGKKFRDEIVAGALLHNSGWVDYIYTKPNEGGLYYKTTYYKLTYGSDGKIYIVCSGKYK